MTDVFSVSSLEEYIKIVERFSPNFSLSRGQGSDLPLFPSALRRDQDGMRLYSKTTIQSFLEDFKFNSQMYIEGASTYHENDWLIHAQHFGVPTCLLDFTYSHLVSLMFALEKAFDYDQDDEDNAVVWLLDPEALNLKTIGRKEIINLSEEAIDSVRSVDNIHCHLFHFRREQRKLTTLDRISNIHRCHGSFKNQGHIKQKLTSGRKQIRFVNRPEPQRTPIVHCKLKSGIRTGIFHVLTLIEFTEDFVLLANRSMRILCIIGIAKDREPS